MNKLNNALDKALDKINNTTRTSLINCHLVVQELVIDIDNIIITFDKDSTIFLEVTIDKNDFIDWIEDNEINTYTSDETDYEGNHIQREHTLEFEGYCNESNIKQYLNEGGVRTVKEL